MPHSSRSAVAWPAPPDVTGISHTASPAVFPAGVSQASVLYRPDVDVSRLMARLGFAIPPAMASAVPKRQMEFALGRLCALEAMARLGVRRPRPPVARAPLEGPAWPSGVVGSITHTDGFVSAAVAWAVEADNIAIDSQAIVSVERGTRIASMVATAGELALAADAGCDPATSVTMVFSIKETLFKCLHALVGRRFDYRDAQIERVEAAGGVFEIRLLSRLAPSFPAGTRLSGRFTNDSRFVHTGMVRARSTAPNPTHAGF